MSSQQLLIKELIKNLDISYDSNNQLKFISPEITNSTNELIDKTAIFNNKLSEFQSTINELIHIYIHNNTIINNHKKYATGLLSQIDNEYQIRSINENNLNNHINQSKLSLNQLNDEYDILYKIIQEQKSTIQKLQKL